MDQLDEALARSRQADLVRAVRRRPEVVRRARAARVRRADEL